MGRGRVSLGDPNAELGDPTNQIITHLPRRGVGATWRRTAATTRSNVSSDSLVFSATLQGRSSAGTHPLGAQGEAGDTPMHPIAGEPQQVLRRVDVCLEQRVAGELRHHAVPAQRSDARHGARSLPVRPPANEPVRTSADPLITHRL